MSIGIIESYIKHIEFANVNYQAMQAIKSAELKYLAASDKYAWLMGYTSAQQLIGKTDHELNNQCIRNYADYYRHEDQQVLAEKSRITTINNHYFADNSGFSVWQFNKIQIIQADKAIAIFITGVEIYEYPELLHLFQAKFGARAFKLISDQDELISPLTHLRFKLTNYQLEICFLSLLGFNNTELANFFNRHNRYLVGGKPRTENNIKHMKLTICQKLGLLASSQHNIFIEQLQNLKFYHYVPLSLYQAIFNSTILR